MLGLQLNRVSKRLVKRDIKLVRYYNENARVYANWQWNVYVSGLHNRPSRWIWFIVTYHFHFFIALLNLGETSHLKGGFSFRKYIFPSQFCWLSTISNNCIETYDVIQNGWRYVTKSCGTSSVNMLVDQLLFGKVPYVQISEEGI